MTEITVTVENVGGIDAAEYALSEPATLVTGPNSSNKTSLLRALAFGFGHPTVPIRTDADRARVEIEYDGRHLVRTATRTDAGVAVSGDGWLGDGCDVELLERFACLLEFNDVRTAIRLGEPFEELLKSPAKLNELERERAEAIERKNELRREREGLDGVEDELAEKSDELDAARERVDALEAELADLEAERAAVAETDDDVESLRERRAELVSRRAEQRDHVADLEAAVERIDDRLEEVEAELEEAKAEAENDEVDALREERDRIRRELRETDDRIDVLQSVLTANREMLDSPAGDLLGTERGLVEDESVCWACGNDAPTSDFEETIDELVDLVKREKARRREFEPRLEELDDRIEAARDAARRVEELEGELQRLERNRSDRVDSLETRRERLAAVEEEIEDVSATLEAREADQQSAVSDVSERIEETRVDLHAAEGDVDRLESVVEDLEADRQRRHEIDGRLEELDEEIAALTERIENLEGRLREEFNDAMDDLLEVLDYDRVERIWLDGDFELIVAREVDGVTRGDSVDHLSESEREMVGLVLALAGYVTYDVADAVPILLLDTLGAFDATRTADLIEYFADEAPFLIAGLLPDSAAAVESASDEYATINPRKRTVEG